MAMEVHDAHGCNMDCFIKECAHLFHNRESNIHLSLSFCIQFFRQYISIDFLCPLTSIIKKKIVLKMMFVLDLPLLLDLTICMQVTLEGLWVK